MQAFEQALSAQRNGRFEEAEVLYRRILSKEPNNFDVLHMLGIVCSENGNPLVAESFFMAALSIDSKYPPLLQNYGLFLDKQKRYQESVDQFDAALKLFGEYAPIYCDRGISLMELGRLDEALSSHDIAVKLGPNVPVAFFNRGNTLFRKREYASALGDYDRAVALNGNYADAYCGRGNVCHAIKRYEEGLVAYGKAIALKPDLAEAWLGRGNILGELMRDEDAAADYDKAIALKPNLAEAWVGRGNVLGELNCDEVAAAAYDKAIVLKPDLAEAWLGRGNIFVALKRYEEALAAFDRAFSLKPDLAGVGGLRLHSKMLLCDWSNFDAECANLISSVNNGKVATQPFPLLAVSSSPRERLECARLWINYRTLPTNNAKWRGGIYPHVRIRIAYLSADFCHHATAYLIAGLFEQHDKSRFEITGMSFGSDQDSDMRRRIKRSFEHFKDVGFRSDQEIAELSRRLEIDIAIDLKGFTQYSRPNVFARRPAPIQVNYLGYPGTMGADYFDYILADSTVVPEDQFEFYSEKVVWLPDTYQVNDVLRTSERTPTRRECRLPESAFVFCCFNNTYKITPEVFDIWMRLLKANEDSVLWLIEGNSKATANLKQEATKRGVSSERLIFAPKIPLAHHLARHRQANLFLDTLPYNAHTTASDALWAGLPVLTCLGSTFAGRVAASLVRAIGLPEMVVESLSEYEHRALQLAREPEALSAIKAKLARNRDSFPLFDTVRFTRNIETTFTAMWERHQRGEAPQSFVVDPN
jgi:protein O-GlcNAc transferase